MMANVDELKVEDSGRRFLELGPEALRNRKRLRALLCDGNAEVDRAAVGSMMDWLEAEAVDFELKFARGRYRGTARVSAVASVPVLVRVGFVLPEVLANLVLDVDDARRPPAVENSGMVFCSRCTGLMVRNDGGELRCGVCGHDKAQGDAAEADEIPMVFCPSCRGGMVRSRFAHEFHCGACGMVMAVDMDPDGDHA